MAGCSRDPKKARQGFINSGLAYEKKGDHKAAIIQFQNALRYDRGSAEVLADLAESYLANRQPLEAFTALMAAVKIDPNRADVQRNLAAIYLSASDRDFDKVLEHASVAVVPGEAFGTPGYFRLSYALADDDLVTGVTRMADLFGEAK